MASLNKYMSLGRVSDIKHTNAGTRFTFNVKEIINEKDRVLKITAWAFGDLAEKCKDLKENDRVDLEGKLSTRKVETTSGVSYRTELIITELFRI